MNLMAWTDAPGEGRALRDVIAGITHSAECLQSYAHTDYAGFVNLLYRNVPSRDAAGSEIGDLLSVMGAGQSCEDVGLGSARSKEFRTETTGAALQWAREFGSENVLDGGAGANDLLGATMADRFIITCNFSYTDTDVTALIAGHKIFDVEPWDLLDFGSFGYETPGNSAQQMVQFGSDVVFSDQVVTVVLKNFVLADAYDDMISI